MTHPRGSNETRQHVRWLLLRYRVFGLKKTLQLLDYYPTAYILEFLGLTIDDVKEEFKKSNTEFVESISYIFNKLGLSNDRYKKNWDLLEVEYIMNS